MRLLRQYIRFILVEAGHSHDDGEDPEDKKKDNKADDLLLEPDASREKVREKNSDEINAIGMGGGSPISRGTMTGVTTPLGTGPTYPSKRKKKKKKTAKEGGVDWYKN